MIAELNSTLYALWDRRWVALVVAWLVALVGGGLIYSHHDRFEASAKVFVDTQTVLKPLMAGLTVQPDIDQQVAMLARTLISRPNLEQLIWTPGVGFAPDSMTERQREALVNDLVRDIKMVGGGRDNLYTLTYRAQDPRRAERVVRGLVQLFMEAGPGNGKRESREALTFIDEQIASYEEKLSAAESRLKDFKLKNLGFNGQATNADYYSRVGQLTDDLVQLRGQLRAAEGSRDAIQRELNGEQPMLIPEGIAGSGMPAISDTDVRLEALRKQLDELLRRYTDEHPDVISTRRLIAQLEREKKSEMQALSSGSAGKDGMKYSTATNPVFQRFRISLAESEATVASLRSRVSDLESRLAELRSAAGRQPQIEAEYAKLNRDYDVIRKNYEQLVARRESATMSQSVDQTSQLANFKVIEPPYVQPKPVFPGRTTLILVLLVVSLASGVGAAIGLNQLYPTINSLKALRELSQRPVLGAISLVAEPLANARARTLNIAFFSGVGVLVATNLFWAVWTTIDRSPH